MRVLIADGLSKEGLAAIRKIPGLNLEEHAALEREELLKTINSVDILVVRSRTQVDRALLERAPNLKLAIRAGIGLDNIDVPAATDLGVVVMNAPTGNIVTTAEHTLAMLFAITRFVPQADASMRAGKWEKKKFQGKEIRGKTLGLVGLGNIGKAVAERALGLQMNVIASDPCLSPEAAAKHRVQLVTFEQLLAQADYISVHVPLVEATKHLINAEAFKKMKKGVYLINCARGGIVDEKALFDALESKIVAGSALDVFETEPLPEKHFLLSHPNVVCTPHLGASTDEAQVQVGLEVAEQISHYVDGGALKNAINVPNLPKDQVDVLKPALNLCEGIGSFAAQVGTVENVRKIHIRYFGMGQVGHREVLTLSVLKGFLTSLLQTPINWVTAKKALKERGIRLEESWEETSENYASLVEVRIEGATEFECAGTLFGSEPRIVRINQFLVDAVPKGALLFTKNRDLPGVIGHLGTCLGTAKVNIARMSLGRDPGRGEAIALTTVDSAVSSDTLESLRAIPGMVSVTQVKL